MGNMCTASFPFCCNSKNEVHSQNPASPKD